MELTEQRVTELVGEALKQQLGAAVNGAVTDQMKRAMGKQSDALMERVNEALGDFDPMANAKPEGGKAKAEPAAPDTAMAKRLADLEAKNKAQEVELATNAKRDALKAALKANHLTGMSDFTISGVLASMEESGGAYYVGDTNVAEWAKGYAASDEGKRHIPANPGSGTGARLGIGNGATSGKPVPGSKEELVATLRRNFEGSNELI